MAKRDRYTNDGSALAANPFGDLAAKLGDLAPGPEPGASPPQAAEASVVDRPAVDLSVRLVVRRQKKGQGGKTATFVEGIGREQAAALLPAIKRELGCGGRVDDDALVVGTAEHHRVAQWLRDRGATRVTLGN